MYYTAEVTPMDQLLHKILWPHFYPIHCNALDCTAMNCALNYTGLHCRVTPMDEVLQRGRHSVPPRCHCTYKAASLYAWTGTQCKHLHRLLAFCPRHLGFSPLCVFVCFLKLVE